MRKSTLFKKIVSGLLPSQPVSRLLLVGLCIVALLPISLLTLHLRQAVWEDSWREIGEKHQLLAENLTAPIKIYISKQRELLRLLSRSLIQAENPEHLLLDALQNTDGFASLIYVRGDSKVAALAETAVSPTSIDLGRLVRDQCFTQAHLRGEPCLSGVQQSVLREQPTMVMAQPLPGSTDGKPAVLMGELSLGLIETLRSNVQFGIKGHAAIVDQFGRVVAHPMRNWVAEIRDLSSLSVVQQAMAGHTGVTEFFSPALQAEMVAGYAAVPDLGWGVIVPQPKAEVEARVDEMMASNYLWGGLGLLMAGVFGCGMTLWIISPINRLAQDARCLGENELRGSIAEPEAGAPREVRQLGGVLSRLVESLQHANREVEDLNLNLQARVNVATRQLRVANARLAEVASSDHLTSLFNRRHFEDELGRLYRERGEQAAHQCVMLVDIDHFKLINDTHGHAVGDQALVRIARILDSHMRAGDLLTRYGGDEFAAHLDCSQSIAVERAEEIRSVVERSTLNHDGGDIQLTVSVGLFCHRGAPKGVNDLMCRVDQAMYQAKRAGRNRVALLNSVGEVAANR